LAILPLAEGLTNNHPTWYIEDNPVNIGDGWSVEEMCRKIKEVTSQNEALS
jgi:uncharacterized protein (DUF736 family)